MKHDFRVVSARSASLVTCTLLLWALSVSSALANTAVVVPPSTDMTASVDLLETAANELMRLIKVQGFDVISPGQASAAAEGAQQSGTFPAQFNVLDCRSIECAVEYRRLFDASFAAQVMLSGSAGRLRTVTVTITESASTSFSATAMLQAGDLKGALQSAYGAARDKYVRGEGPWLSIRGEPAGAQVLVDGQEYGALPIEHRYIGKGTHRIEVRAEGYATRVQELEIPARVDHEEQLELSLMQTAGGKHRDPKFDRTWDYVLGGVIAAAGLTHLALGAYQQSKRGDCAEKTSSGCTLYYGDYDGIAQEKMLLGFGAAGVALGATWMAAAPIARIRLRADTRSAGIGVQGSF